MEPEQIFPEIFDDASAMARAGVDLDIFDSMRALLGDGIDLDDRVAVEQAILAPDDYRHNPKTFARFVGECIRSAKANKAAGGIRRDALGESGFVLAPEPISAVPALTLLEPNDGCLAPWAVTLNDYGPDADSVSTVTTFDTKEEAETFIAECRRGLHRA